MKTLIGSLIVASLMPIASAEACSRRCGCRKMTHRPAYARPMTPAVRFVPAPVQAYSAAPSPQVQAVVIPQGYAPPVQPTYRYEASPGGAPAYYYAYNDNGELVVKQWMDWLFRGGKAAGMPAPPLPIVGRLLRP